MTKICQVTSVHPRYDVRIFHKIAKSVAAHGFESCILVCDTLPEEVKDGVHFYPVPFVAKNRLDRILHSWKKLYKKALEIDADLYHLHDPELMKLGQKLKKAGKKVIFDSHEDYYYKVGEKAWIPKPFRKLARFVYGKKEKHILKKYDGLISVTPHIVERLKKINPETVMITNYPTKMQLPQTKKERILCFAGGVTPLYLHDKVMEAISTVDGVKYCVAGKVSEDYKNYLKTVPGYDKTEFLGMLPYEEVIKLYAKSMVGIVTYDYSRALGGKLGTLGVLKLFEYIQYNIPMIATDFELWKPIVEGNQVGVCVNPHEVGQIRNAVLKLMNDDEFRNTCSKNCDKIKDQYCWESQEKILLDFYKSILQGKKVRA